MKAYYVLVAKEEGQWAIQFGDFDREVVEQEKLDYIDSYGGKCKVIKARECSQSVVDAAVRSLNGGV